MLINRTLNTRKKKFVFINVKNDNLTSQLFIEINNIWSVGLSNNGDSIFLIASSMSIQPKRKRTFPFQNL